MKTTALGFTTKICVIQPSLSPRGQQYAFRHNLQERASTPCHAWGVIYKAPVVTRHRVPFASTRFIRSESTLLNFSSSTSNVFSVSVSKDVPFCTCVSFIVPTRWSLDAISTLALVEGVLCSSSV